MSGPSNPAVRYVVWWPLRVVFGAIVLLGGLLFGVVFFAIFGTFYLYTRMIDKLADWLNV